MFFQSAFKTIDKYSLLKPNDSVIIAISGGPDSVALFHFLLGLKSKLNLRLHLAHLNHKLRGEESDADAQFVRELAKQYQVSCTIHAEDIATKNKQEKLSLQATARKYRYRFLQLVAQGQKANKIAIAHNADDQVETFILRLLRGSGTAGLGAMRPQNGKVIRPFLETGRQEIEAYLAKNNFVYRIDSSNKKTKYLRNKVRHELLPVLVRDYNPNLAANIRQLADILQEEALFWEEYTNNQLVMVLLYQDAEQIILDGRVLKTMPPALQRQLCRLVIERLIGNLQAISFTHVQQILEAIQKDDGEKTIYLPHDLLVIKQYDKLEIRRGRPLPTSVNKEYPIDIPGVNEIAEMGLKLEAQILPINEMAADFLSKTSDHLCYLDYDKVKAPLLIRTRRPGDRFTPLGMSAEKKLKNFLIDGKTPQSQRDGIPLLVSGKEILWVIGLRISDKYKVDQTSQNILCLKAKDTGNRLYDALSHPVPNFQI